ncbi:hypothetical protein DEF28_06870 [Marinitenerispora sediminis]|uniref:CRISPR-associated protein Csx10 n=1 Tax=Marinitenerispora sediminis TaxID=1931232 RepID=A0A368TA74_9ACTN|nr:hypothetical protein DEF28_06870 [Marinitenerispora sediminis]RCV61417.1 hypothetical protein DEF24_04260 [Marinitenerispora sediminis]
MTESAFTPVPGGGGVTGYLRLRYHTTQSMVLRTDLNPLFVRSAAVIEGRVQRGMLASVLHRAGRRDLVPEWVARGAVVRFATAFPLLEPEGMRPTPTIPAPRWLRAHVEKGVGVGLVDTLAARGGDTGRTGEGGRTRSYDGLVTPDLRYRAVPAMSTEQYLGRGDGGGPGSGTPFLTTSVDHGQVFEARWQLRAPDEAGLRALAAEIRTILVGGGHPVTLGADRTRAHGGRVLVGTLPGTPGGDSPLAVDRTACPASAWPAGEHRDLVVLAPALIVDDRGQPHPGALPAAVRRLAERVVGPDAVAVEASHIEPCELVGYHVGYRSEMAQRWAAAPGSVVRLRAMRDLAAEEVRALESVPLGTRTVDGNGAFVLLPEPDLSRLPEDRVPTAAGEAGPPYRRNGGGPGTPVTLANGESAQVSSDGLAAAVRSEAGKDAPLAALYDKLLWNACARVVRDRARAVAAASAEAGPLPTRSLLGRLREVAAASAPGPGVTLKRLAGVAAGEGGKMAHLAAPFKPFTGKAAKAVESARVEWQGKRVTFPAWLTAAATAPAEWRAGAFEDADAALARAIAPVDLTAPDPASGVLSPAATSWLGDPRVADRLALLLVTTWLAEAAARARPHDEERAENRAGTV